MSDEIQDLRDEIRRKDERMLLLEAENSELKAYKGMYAKMCEQVDSLTEALSQQTARTKAALDELRIVPKQEAPKSKAKPPKTHARHT